MIYGDVQESGLVYYVRLIPDMDLEETEFPHGISIGNMNFRSPDEAIILADKIDLFMEKMMESLKKSDLQSPPTE